MLGKKRVFSVVVAVVLVASAFGLSGCIDIEDDELEFIDTFDDPNLRKAIAWAIDADEVIEMEMTEELADNTRSPVPEGHAAHNPDLMLYEQDIDEARRLIEEAGYEENDDGMYFETALYVPDDERANEMLVVQEHLEEAGIELNLEPLEWAEYISAVDAGEAPLSYSGWSGTPSAQYIMAYMMEGSPWAYYSGWYEGTEFTEKIEQAVREPDDDTRWSLYHEAQEILVEDDMGCYIVYTERMPRAYHESLDIPEESWNPYMGAGPLVSLPEWELEDEGERLEIAQRHEPEDFHPIRYSDVYTAYVFIQMYDTLISTYPDAVPNAEADGTIAESFEISDDGLEITFEIEEGLEFHNGDEVTAHDAEFTINTMMMDEDDDEYFDLYDVDENPASPRSGDFANVDYVEAVDDYTLEIHMENRDMEILQSGGFESLYILPSEYIQENGWEDYENNLFGSGPYELEDRTPGVEVILTAFEDYRHDVNIEEVRFDFIDEETGAITSLRAGDVHYMSRIYPSNYHDLADEDDVITRSFQDLGHNRIAFNQQTG